MGAPPYSLSLSLAIKIPYDYLPTASTGDNLATWVHNKDGYWCTGYEHYLLLRKLRDKYRHSENKAEMWRKFIESTSNL